nr:MAG: polyprotein [Hepatovirus sp.]
MEIPTDYDFDFDFEWPEFDYRDALTLGTAIDQDVSGSITLLQNHGAGSSKVTEQTQAQGNEGNITFNYFANQYQNSVDLSGNSSVNGTSDANPNPGNILSSALANLANGAVAALPALLADPDTENTTEQADRVRTTRKGDAAINTQADVGRYALAGSTLPPSSCTDVPTFGTPATERFHTTKLATWSTLQSTFAVISFKISKLMMDKFPNSAYAQLVKTHYLKKCGWEVIVQCNGTNFHSGALLVALAPEFIDTTTGTDNWHYMSQTAWFDPTLDGGQDTSNVWQYPLFPSQVINLRTGNNAHIKVPYCGVTQTTYNSTYDPWTLVIMVLSPLSFPPDVSKTTLDITVSIAPLDRCANGRRYTSQGPIPTFVRENAGMFLSTIPDTTVPAYGRIVGHTQTLPGPITDLLQIAKTPTYTSLENTPLGWKGPRVTIGPDLSAGDILFSFDLSLTSPALANTAVATVSSHFAQYRGSFNIQLMFAGAAATRGKLFLAYVPPGVEVQSITMDQLLAGPNLVWDLGLQSTITWDIPFISVTDFRYTNTSATRDNINIGGWVFCGVLQPLNFPLGATHASTVIVSFAAGPDFTLRCPVTPFGRLYGEGEITSNAEDGAPPAAEPEVQIQPVCSNTALSFVMDRSSLLATPFSIGYQDVYPFDYGLKNPDYHDRPGVWHTWTTLSPNPYHGLVPRPNFYVAASIAGTSAGNRTESFDYNHISLCHWTYYKADLEITVERMAEDRTVNFATNLTPICTGFKVFWFPSGSPLPAKPTLPIHGNVSNLAPVFSTTTPIASGTSKVSFVIPYTSVLNALATDFSGDLTQAGLSPRMLPGNTWGAMIIVEDSVYQSFYSTDDAATLTDWTTGPRRGKFLVWIRYKNYRAWLARPARLRKPTLNTNSVTSADPFSMLAPPAALPLKQFTTEAGIRRQLDVYEDWNEGDLDLEDALDSDLENQGCLPFFSFSLPRRVTFECTWDSSTFTFLYEKHVCDCCDGVRPVPRRDVIRILHAGFVHFRLLCSGDVEMNPGPCCYPLWRNSRAFLPPKPRKPHQPQFDLEFWLMTHTRLDCQGFVRRTRSGNQVVEDYFSEIPTGFDWMDRLERIAPEEERVPYEVARSSRDSLRFREDPRSEADDRARRGAEPTLEHNIERLRRMDEIEHLGAYYRAQIVARSTLEVVADERPLQAQGIDELVSKIKDKFEPKSSPSLKRKEKKKHIEPENLDMTDLTREVASTSRAYVERQKEIEEVLRRTTKSKSKLDLPKKKEKEKEPDFVDAAFKDLNNLLNCGEDPVARAKSAWGALTEIQGVWQKMKDAYNSGSFWIRTFFVFLKGVVYASLAKWAESNTALMLIIFLGALDFMSVPMVMDKITKTLEGIFFTPAPKPPELDTKGKDTQDFLTLLKKFFKDDKVLDNQSGFMDFVKDTNTSVTFLKGIEWLFQLVTKVIEWIKAWYRKDEASAPIKLAAKMQIFPQVAERLMEARTRCTEAGFQRDIAYMKEVYQLASACNKGALANLAAKLSNTVRVNEHRTEPVVVILRGDPGAGKSVAAQIIAQAVSKLMTGMQSVYSIPPDPKYFDNYDGQYAVILDDLAQNPNGLDFATFCQMVSSTHFTVPMADVADKGKLFVSKLIVGTTNVSDFRPVTIACPDAVNRRIYLDLEVRPHTAYATRDGKLHVKRATKNIGEGFLCFTRTFPMMFSHCLQFHNRRTGEVLSLLDVIAEVGDKITEKDRVRDRVGALINQSPACRAMNDDDDLSDEEDDPEDSDTIRCNRSCFCEQYSEQFEDALQKLEVFDPQTKKQFRDAFNSAFAHFHETVSPTFTFTQNVQNIFTTPPDAQEEMDEVDEMVGIYQKLKKEFFSWAKLVGTVLSAVGIWKLISHFREKDKTEIKKLEGAYDGKAVKKTQSKTLEVPTNEAAYTCDGCKKKTVVTKVLEVESPKKRPPQRPPQPKLKLSTFEGSVSMDTLQTQASQEVMDFEVYTARNVVFPISFFMEGKVTPYTQSVIAVKKNFVLVNRHSWDAPWHSCMIRDVLYYKNQFDASNTLSYSVQGIPMDLVLVALPTKTHFKDNLSKFKKQKEAWHSTGTRVLGVMNTDMPLCYSGSFYTLPRVTPTVEANYAGMFLYRAHTKRGYCGSAVVASLNGRKCIIGLHGAGANGIAGASKVTQEMLEQGNALLEQPFGPNCAPTSPTTLQSQGLMTQLPDGPHAHVSRRTKIKPSIAYPVFKPKAGPAALSRNDPRLAEGVDLDTAIFSKHTADQVDYPKIFRVYAREYANRVFTLLGRDNGPLSFEDAVLGMPGLDKMEDDTSAGYPYTVQNQKRTDLVDFETGKPIDSDFVNAYNKMIEGDYSDHVFQTFLKDEVRSLEKVRVGKTRIVDVPSLPHCSIGRQLLGRFAAKYQSNPGVELGSAIGCNPDVDWTRFAADLNRFENVYDIDYSNFDSTHGTGMFQILIEEFFTQENGFDPLVGPYLMSLAHSNHAYEKTRLHIEGGLPSGCAFTFFLNTVLTNIIIRSLLKLTYSNFEFDDISILSYGDDLLVGPDYVIDFNKVADVAKEHTLYKLTPASKAGSFPLRCVLEECTFLKRHFVPCKTGSFIYKPVMETGTLEQILSFYKPGTLAEKLISVAQLAVHSGPIEYNHLFRPFREQGHFVPEWWTLEDQWESHFFG